MKNVEHKTLLLSGEKIDPLDYFKSSASSKVPHQYVYGFSAPRPELTSLDLLVRHQSSENLDPAKPAPLLTSTLIKSAQEVSSTHVSRSSDSDMAPPPQGYNRVINKARQRIIGSQASDSPVTPRYSPSTFCFQILFSCNNHLW